MKFAHNIPEGHDGSAASSRERACLDEGVQSDELFFDAAQKRVYVVCGEGKVEVFSPSLSREATIDTSRGARTGVFVPEYRRLYVAAPAAGGTPARILVFEATNP